jgi:transposase
VDFMDGRTVERIAAPIWSQEYGARPVAALDQRGHPGEAMASFSRPTPGAGANSVGRVLCGWHLRTRQKGGPKVGKTKRGKGTKLMVLVDGAGTPLGLHVAAASPAEVTLLDATLATVHVPRAHRAGRPRQRPDRLIADRGYDSNAVRAALDTRGIQPIIPARSNNRRATHQDGRCLRRYRRRWIVERSNAWLYNFRRLVVRYERSADIYTALVHLACALITLKRVFG